MKTRLKLALFILLNLTLLQIVGAKIKLPAIVSSNMVLQRNAKVTIWGWANPSEKVLIEASWLEKNINVVADKNGNWKTKIKTTNSKEVQSITLKSKESNIELKNILFGEVWLCSGQSNMYQPVIGYKGQPTFGGLEAIVKSKNPNIRLFTVNKSGSTSPLKDLESYEPWQEATPSSVKNFSSVGYFFGKQLNAFLDVPIGLIHTSWGGSIVEAWMSEDVLKEYQTIKIDMSDKKYNRKQTLLFNAMINPIIPYTIKGSLWYQGEQNRLQPVEYTKLFPAMVKDWRNRWNIGDFPFYYVQIAPYRYEIDAYTDFENSAFQREAQLKCSGLIPNSGMVVTMDIGDKNCIHPPRKKEVADRLLYLALNKTYGYDSIESDSPQYESMEVKDNGILLNFSSEKSAIYAYNLLEGFEIAGKDRVFYPATAKVMYREKVFVKSDKVKKPIAVRYAWQNWIIGTLYGANMLPVSSFRTDDWGNATRSKD